MLFSKMVSSHFFASRAASRDFIVCARDTTFSLSSAFFALLSFSSNSASRELLAPYSVPVDFAPLVFAAAKSASAGILFGLLLDITSCGKTSDTEGWLLYNPQLLLASTLEKEISELTLAGMSFPGETMGAPTIPVTAGEELTPVEKEGNAINSTGAQ